MPFHWTRTHQENFDLIKNMMINPPILYLLQATGRFILYSEAIKLILEVVCSKDRMANLGCWAMPAKHCQNRVLITILESKKCKA